MKTGFLGLVSVSDQAGQQIACLPSDPIGQIERKNNGGFLAKTEFKQ